MFLFVDTGSYYEQVLIDVMSDSLMSRGVIFFMWLDLISSMFSTFVSGSNLDSSILPPILLMLLIFSIYYSKYVVILEIFLSYSISFDVNLCVVYFSTLLSSERCIVYNLRLTDLFLIVFYSLYFFLSTDSIICVVDKIEQSWLQIFNQIKNCFIRYSKHGLEGVVYVWIHIE